MIPDRVRWAVDTLAVEPDDHVLEIGCGSGAAAALVHERLETGSVLGIDRSATQVERARRRHVDRLASGRLAFEEVELARLVARGRPFDKAFAINVNAFWTGRAEAELARVLEVLAERGRLFLFYEVPPGADALVTAGRAFMRVGDAGFEEPTLLRPSPRRLCLIARPSPPAPVIRLAT